MEITKEIKFDGIERAPEVKPFFIPQASKMYRPNWIVRKWFYLRSFLPIIWIALGKITSPYKIFRALKLMEKNRRSYQGDHSIRKIARVEKRYFRDISIPGFPSPILNSFYENALNRIYPFKESKGLMLMYFAITNKCAYQCEHCYEWDNINKPDGLSSAEIVSILKSYQKNGLGVVYLEGGEPLLRYKDLKFILEQCSDKSDFWIISSGYHLNKEKAIELKKSGLTGVMISLDHYNEESHNKFRGYSKSYEWAINAILNANASGLVTAISLCATKEFVNSKNMVTYFELAKSLGVSFVQILEPRATGKYNCKEVDLSSDQQVLLEKIFIKYNSKKDFDDYPLITYPAYHQRRAGCFGAGDLYLFVDSEGDVHSCPFCRNKIAHSTKYPEDIILSLVNEFGCQKYPMAREKEVLETK